MKPTCEQRVWMYEVMYRSRCLDDAVLAAYMQGKTPVFHMGKGSLPGEMHQSFGQEPDATMAGMRPVVEQGGATVTEGQPIAEITRSAALRAPDDR